MKSGATSDPLVGVVDREAFRRHMARLLKYQSTVALRRFLAESLLRNRGTEGEALIIELTEARLAARAATSRPKRG